MSAEAHTPEVVPPQLPAEPLREVTLARLAGYFLRLGCSGFGGPIALVGYMQRDLVEDRRWFSEEEYRQGLALAQTMPGPLAAQLAMWSVTCRPGCSERPGWRSRSCCRPVCLSPR
jgi:hypothetical protein